MPLEIAVDPRERNAVRVYIEAAQQKPAEEQVAFNEGVMCAAFALGAYIDGSRGLNADATAILERAFSTMTGVKIKVVHQLPPEHSSSHHPRDPDNG